MDPTPNDQQAAGAGVPADNPPAAMPGQVVSPSSSAGQSDDGVMTISHDDSPAAAPAAPATPAAPAAASEPNPNDVSLADEKPAAIEYRSDGTPIAVSSPGVPYEPAPPPEPLVEEAAAAPAADAATPADPNAGTPPAPQQ